MGAQIAAHLANAGLPVFLLDLTEAAARDGLARAVRLKPDPFFTAGVATTIRTGSFDDLADAGGDWIIEAVIEDLEVKRELAARVDAVRATDAVVSSNTSGIPLALIAEGRSDGFRRHWLGTHFFNPPRYLQLLELIPTADTDPAVVATIAGFADRRLGKGVVVAKDTPAFIANHLGVFGVVRLLDALASGDFTIEEIDEITGPLIGRPKSATFRTLDIAGLDILAHVAADLARRLPRLEDRRHFELPPLVTRMVERGLVGVKTGRGFYIRDRGADKTDASESRILALDPATLEYRERRRTELPALEAARALPTAADRLRALWHSRDKAGHLVRRTLGPTLLYAARVAPDIASSIDDVDRAMKWGFGWELGPFETWDAIGVRAVLDACGDVEPPRLIQAALDAGRDAIRQAPLEPAGPDLLILRSAKARSRVVKTNAGASLVDLGDGVLGVEFHSKMNTIGGDAIEMIDAGVREASANFAALVVASEAELFSAGANLMLLLLEAQEGHWDEIDQMVRAFQHATMSLKTAAVPVVAAPSGLALGGGCEICLHADRVQAAAESYMGLVEVGVGLIPAGGGTKEMLLRGLDLAGQTDPTPRIQQVFETIGFGRVSTSAPDSVRLGYLRGVDGMTMNRERLVADAKASALARARDFRPLARRAAVTVGGADMFALLSLGVHLALRAGRLSDHDALIGRKLAWVLSGGNLPHKATVTEDDLLDLEREAFLSLVGERKTLERIGYTLKTGRTLRN
jgi:3-hydroxyacyl-CoA dehydrogenase